MSVSLVARAFLRRFVASLSADCAEMSDRSTLLERLLRAPRAKLVHECLLEHALSPPLVLEVLDYLR